MKQRGRRLSRAAVAFAALMAAAVVEPGSGATAVGAEVNWAALGDSYSSGTGLGPVSQWCDRDSFAYAPRAVRDILTSRSIALTHAACSGARIDDVRREQLAAVTPATTLVTITIGGNDIAFAAKVAGCWTSCGPDTMALLADVPQGSQTWDELYRRLVDLYVSIRARMSPSGHVMVLTYPIPFARQVSKDCQGLSPLEQSAANALVTRLDDTIYWAARAADELTPAPDGAIGHVHFVDWRTGSRASGAYVVPSGYQSAGRTFDSWVSPDGLCNQDGQTAYLNGYVSWAPLNPDRANSYHPNSRGYWAGAVLVSEAIKTYMGS